MDKAIIAVEGTANIGKSSVIREFRQQLHASKHSIEYLESDFTKKGGDFTEIFTIDGVRMGIVSEGDPGYGLKENLIKMTSLDCKIILCACRTKGETRNNVYDVIEQGYEYYKFSNLFGGSTSTIDKDTMNKWSAELLMKLVDEMVRSISND